MDEKTKYETVWAQCERYGKNWADKGLGRPYKRPFQQKVQAPATVIDFGCGNGTSLTWLWHLGHEPYGIEIAENAIKQHRQRIEVADLRFHIDMPSAEWGLCTDVMEHIPTGEVPLVLSNISQKVTKGCLFGIARLPDKDGDALGLELHLTIRDKGWWDPILLTFFRELEEVRYDDGVYIVWGLK
jgi:2-polyprenyl-3-methyl-5-hydroxy-6-metoxy-1,4-benzoquinol methylase